MKNMPPYTAWICLVMICCCASTIGCSHDAEQSTQSAVEPAPMPAAEQPAAVNTSGSAHAGFYTVSTYDKKLDPADDFAKTIARAQKENKRIILQVGGDWCIWCTRITDYMSTNPKIRSHLNENFLVMKVTYPGDFAEDFLSKYPKCEAYPHFFVLEKDGTFLHSQGTGELEKGKGYDEEVFMEFLTQWTS